MFTLSPTQMLSHLMIHKLALSLTCTRTHSRCSPTLNHSHVLALTNPRDPTGTSIRFLSYTDPPSLTHQPVLIDIHLPSLIHLLSLIPALCHIHTPLCHTHLLGWLQRLPDVQPYEAQVGQGGLPLRPRPNLLGWCHKCQRGCSALSSYSCARTATGTCLCYMLPLCWW